MTDRVRTRFAPSPTGYLHIGSARTALFSWLYARHHKGQFILRIEDTDLERSTKEAVDVILESMAWLGLDYDEGPFYQSRRFERYRAVAHELLASGKAYRCYCSKERLENLRAAQLAHKEKPRYDGFCRHRTDNISTASYVIRFANPQEGQTIVEDKVHGRVVFQNSELDDLIILRTDGTPTYNFTVVVDDMDMAITHVIRGDDHLNNTPRQINLFQALNVKLPIYAHIPMVLAPNKKKYSKRDGAASVMEYYEMGYLREALLNYLVRLGWSHGNQEIFSIEEMIESFNLDTLQPSAAVFNLEKLLWLNQHYIKTLNPEIIEKYLKHEMSLLEIDLLKGPVLREVVLAQQERSKTVKEMAEKSRYFYEEITSAISLSEEDKALLNRLEKKLNELEDWNKSTIHEAISDTALALNIKLGKVAQPFRCAITGTDISPPIDVTAALIGKSNVLSRLKRACL